MTTNQFLAFDLGASSGRAILGKLTDGKLELDEIHRFSNQMTTYFGEYHWNLFHLFSELKYGLKACAIQKIPIRSVGLDTWGVDFGFLASDGSPLGIPFAYRDQRTDGAMDEVFRLIPREKIYELTGIQFMQLNSLYQLYVMQRDKSPVLQAATDLLFMPDLINYLFTGVKKTEFSFATTSQLFNPRTNKWEQQIFDAINVPVQLMQSIIKPGEIIENINHFTCKETGINPIPVVAVGSHDTASAIAAVPADGDNWAYLSSGTWSLMGIEAQSPIITPNSLAAEFTNEGGVENTIRFLKNITGLWLVQECKRIWDIDKKYTYPQLVEMADNATPFQAFVDTDAQEFMNPDYMPKAIMEYWRKTKQPVSENHGDIVRSVFESLAMKYRFVIDLLRETTNKQIDKLHIIGGGSQNELLCQFAANATGIPVIGGPAEATAIGNILMQAKALGVVKSLGEIREIVRNSFDVKTYNPENINEWNSAYERYLEIIQEG